MGGKKRDLMPSIPPGGRPPWNVRPPYGTGTSSSHRAHPTSAGLHPSPSWPLRASTHPPCLACNAHWITERTNGASSQARTGVPREKMGRLRNTPARTGRTGSGVPYVGGPFDDGHNPDGETDAIDINRG